MFRKFVFVLVVLLAETPRSTLSYCIVANLLAMMLQYYYRPFNCFDCLLRYPRDTPFTQIQGIEGWLERFTALEPLC